MAGVSRAQQRGRGEQRGHGGQKAAWLPLDVVAEIAARSDPATLVRCAATCREARRRIAENPILLGRLRLRDTGRFVLPLLHGHLSGITTCHTGADVYMVDTTTAADATDLVKATSAFAEPDETLTDVSMDSRGGLVLVRATTTSTTTTTDKDQQKLFVCNLATRCRQTLLPEPAFPDDDVESTGGIQYVLLVGNRLDKGGGGAGDGAAAAVVGRPFQVLKAKLVLSQYRSHRRLFVHTFSSEHGTWSPLRVIPTPNIHGTSDKPLLLSRPLVVGDAVHWLCLTNSGSYMLILHVRTARVNVTSLPESFPRDIDDESNDSADKGHRYLLATATAGGNPVVLVADTDTICAWEQSKHTKKWKSEPQVVIENETIHGFNDDGLAKAVERARRMKETKRVPKLLWFGERSGVVLLLIHGCRLLWLDLQSKKIIRCYETRGTKVYCPYEVDLSSWVPTFSSAITV